MASSSWSHISAAVVDIWEMGVQPPLLVLIMNVIIPERPVVAAGDGSSNRPDPGQDDIVALAIRSFAEAATAAVAENDRLGLQTHGSINGAMVVRNPPKAMPSK